MQVLKAVGGVVAAPFKLVGSSVGALLSLRKKPGSKEGASSDDLPQLSKEEMTECYTYGLFALCAYADSKQKAQEILSECVVPKELEGTLDQLVDEKRLRLLKYNSRLGDLLPIQTDTEVVLAKLQKGSGYELVLAFRGTEPAWEAGLVSDGLTDIKFMKRPVTEITGLKGRKDLKGCEVHRGFMKSFNDVVNGTDVGSKKTPPITEVVKELFPNGEKPARVVCCGHSLGAALCTLAAFWCKATDQAFNGVDIHCFAFASTRVGNDTFVNKFNELVGNSNCYRFTHKSDIVPCLPPQSAPFWYRHVNRPVFLLQPGQDDYKIYGGRKKPERDPQAYAAVLVQRPIKLYTNADDHGMGGYLAALADVMGLRKAGPQGRISRPPVPHEVSETVDAANQVFVDSVKALEGEIAKDVAKVTQAQATGPQEPASSVKA